MPVSAKLGVTVGMSMTEKQVSRCRFILPQDQLTRLPGRIRRARKHDSCSAGRPSQNWEWRRVLVDRTQVVYIRPNERRVSDTEQHSRRQGSRVSHSMRARRLFAGVTLKRFAGVTLKRCRRRGPAEGWRVSLFRECLMMARQTKDSESCD
jgi:hypothetical protein